jgi:hypothetical protein
MSSSPVESKAASKCLSCSCWASLRHFTQRPAADSILLTRVLVEPSHLAHTVFAEAGQSVATRPSDRAWHEPTPSLTAARRLAEVVDGIVHCFVTPRVVVTHIERSRTFNLNKPLSSPLVMPFSFPFTREFVARAYVWVRPIFVELWVELLEGAKKLMIERSKR